MLENTERAITNGQSRKAGNKGYISSINEIRMKNTTTVQHTIESRRNSSINLNLGKKNKMAKLEGGSTTSNKMDRQINNSERKI